MDEVISYQKNEKEEWQNLLKEGYKLDKDGNKYRISDN